MSSRSSSEIEFLLSNAENNALFRARPDEMLRYSTLASLTAHKAKDEIAIARSEMALGRHALDQGAYVPALDHLRQALVIFQKHQDSERELTTLRHMGIAYGLLEKFDESLSLLTNALRTAYDIGNNDAVGLLHYEIANRYMAQGDIASSIRHYSIALPIFETTNERATTFASHHLGKAHASLRNFKVAEGYLQYAFSRVNVDILQDNTERRVGTSPFDLKLLGDIFSLEADSSQAYQTYLRAFPLLKKFNIPVTEAECLIDLGKSALVLNDYSSAIDYLLQAEQVSKTVLNKGLWNELQLQFAHYYQKVGLFEKAESAQKHVLSYAYSASNSVLRLQALEALAESSESQRNYVSAASYYRQANDILKELGGVREPFIHAPSRRTNDDGNSSTDQIALHNSDLQKLYDRSLRENQQLKDLVRQQQVALISVRDKIQNLGEGQVEFRIAVKDIGRIISSQLEGQAKDENLKQNLEKLSETAIQKLSKKYPSLSAAELQICSLISVGLESKRIEEILCLSHRTVENHRFRIRRKLGLLRSQKLEDAIKSL